MFNACFRHRPRTASLAAKHAAVSVAALAVILLTSIPAEAQSTQSTAPTPRVRDTAQVTALGSGPDLQGLWDFTMRVGERSSTGFFALGPVEGGWAGSLTPDSTNTLAIRVLTLNGDSVRMVVASREGDVLFHGRLIDNARAMEGIVDYHGGARLPMTATRRPRPAQGGGSSAHVFTGTAWFTDRTLARSGESLPNVRIQGRASARSPE